jgi:hypothetical protein
MNVKQPQRIGIDFLRRFLAALYVQVRVGYMETKGAWRLQTLRQLIVAAVRWRKQANLQSEENTEVLC